MIAIKGMNEMPTDCAKCPFMATHGNPNDILSPMMCFPIWATTHEIKHCIGGRVLADCPLVEIVTCKDCKYNVKNGKNTTMCDIGHRFYMREHNTFYCTDAERKRD